MFTNIKCELGCINLCLREGYRNCPLHIDYSDACLRSSQILSIATSLLFANRQISAEALIVLYGENEFNFDACSPHIVEQFARRPRPASLEAVRRVKIDILCSKTHNFNTGSADVAHFLGILQKEFELDAITIPVLVDARPPPPIDSLYYRLREPINSWLTSFNNNIIHLHNYLRSGRVKTLRWTWERVAFTNQRSSGWNSRLGTRLVHLLNQTASEDIYPFRGPTKYHTRALLDGFRTIIENGYYGPNDPALGDQAIWKPVGQDYVITTLAKWED